MQVGSALKVQMALSFCILLLAGCGGGGGSSSKSSLVPGTGSGSGSGSGGQTGAVPTPPPTPTPAPVAYTLPSSATASLNPFSVISNPTGLAVSFNGAGAGNAPLTLHPAYSKSAYAVSFAPTNGNPTYTILTAQSGTIGAGTTVPFVYNQTIDTAGRITGGTSTLAHLRGLASSAPIARRAAASGAYRPHASATQIEITYTFPQLGATSVAAIEARHGITSASTTSQNADGITRIASIAPGTTLDGLRAETGVSAVTFAQMRYPLAATGCTRDMPCYPNDSYFEASSNARNGDQWNVWQIDAQDAWGYLAANDSSPIAIIDTGYDAAQTEIAPLVSYSEKVLNGYIYTVGGSANDTDGHGTFLSGVADALSNNGAGFTGIAYNSPLLEFKITPDVASPGASTADEAQAIRDAVAHNAKVILLAVGGDQSLGPDPVEHDAVEYAIAHGVTVVAGSGNDGASATALDFPAAYPGVIAVGASEINDAAIPGAVAGCASPSSCNSETIASYSNTGPGLGLVAPGGQASGGDSDSLHWIENVWTTQPLAGNLACSTPLPAAGCRVQITGTSPAAAEVAGVAAMMLSVNPALSPAQVAQILYASTDDLKVSGQGHGRLNAQRALALTAGDASPVPAIPTPRNIQFVAFAYTNTGAANAAPAILNASYPAGVPINEDGTFRIADITPASIPAPGYKIGVWLDVNGDGKIDQGDYFAATGFCSKTAACAGAATMSVTAISSASFVLP